MKEFSCPIDDIWLGILKLFFYFSNLKTFLKTNFKKYDRMTHIFLLFLKFIKIIAIYYVKNIFYFLLFLKIIFKEKYHVNFFKNSFFK